MPHVAYVPDTRSVQRAHVPYSFRLTPPHRCMAGGSPKFAKCVASSQPHPIRGVSLSHSLKLAQGDVIAFRNPTQSIDTVSIPRNPESHAIHQVKLFNSVMNKLLRHYGRVQVGGGGEACGRGVRGGYVRSRDGASR